jgi:hypothetical protein
MTVTRQSRAIRAGRWLQMIKTEIEDKLIGLMEASADTALSLPKCYHLTPRGACTEPHARVLDA